MVSSKFYRLTNDWTTKNLLFVNLSVFYLVKIANEVVFQEQLGLYRYFVFPLK